MPQEIDIQRRLDHPNIILLLDAFETQHEFCLITEFAHGELFEILEAGENVHPQTTHLSAKLSDSVSKRVECTIVIARYRDLTRSRSPLQMAHFLRSRCKTLQSK